MRLANSRPARAWWAVGVAAALVAIPACGPGGPEVARVSGKVSRKGKPLTQGNISFVPSGTPERPPASGPIGADGTYSLQMADGQSGAQLGDYNVAVSGEDPNAPNNDIPGMPVKRTSDVPKKYADPNKSNLKATVKSGSNPLDFDLPD